MIHRANINTLLVVLNQDLIWSGESKQSPLIERAASLARRTGCEIELFHACYDGGLENQLFTPGTDLERLREDFADRYAPALADIATRLKNEGIAVRYEVQWDTPRTDAILRKIAQAKPDIVMKQGREHSFVLGITSNTDWDLARRSPANVWLVNDDVESIERIMAAVGNKVGGPGDITTSADYDLLRMAGLIAEPFEAEIYPVNAYQVCEPRSLIAGLDGAVTPAPEIDQEDRRRAQLVKQHSGAVKALAQYFRIPKDNVHIREGHPTQVIPDVADSVGADLIVMGASNISRLERMITSVTVEPVMANSNADILIVRERKFASEQNVADSESLGLPKYDLERAIVSPAATFESPQDVANLPGTSVELRQRILQAWEYDIRAEMVEETEGGLARDIDVDALDEIYSAKAVLDIQQKKPGTGRVALH